MSDRHCEACGQVRFPIDHWQRKLAAAVRDADRYAYVKKHFDELYQSLIWVNDGNPDYRIDSDKFDASIDAAMKEGE